MPNAEGLAVNFFHCETTILNLSFQCEPTQLLVRGSKKCHVILKKSYRFFMPIPELLLSLFLLFIFVMLERKLA